MLEKLQAHFCESVIEGTRPLELLENLAKHYSPEEAEARLAIYQNNFYASLIEHLLETFPTVLKLLGDEFFRALSREYLKAHPPASPCIDQFGGSFANFIADFPPLADYPYIADIARLNYCQHIAWYAEEKPSLPPEDFTRFDIQSLGNASISLDASLHLIESPYAIYRIWEENENEQPGEVHAEHPEAVLIYRELPSYQIHTQLIEKGFYTFLHNLQDQHSLAQSLDAASEVDPHFNASSAIDSLIRSGLSTKIVTYKISPKEN